MTFPKQGTTRNGTLRVEHQYLVRYGCNLILAITIYGFIAKIEFIGYIFVHNLY